MSIDRQIFSGLPPESIKDDIAAAEAPADPVCQWREFYCTFQTHVSDSWLVGGDNQAFSSTVPEENKASNS